MNTQRYVFFADLQFGFIEYSNCALVTELLKNISTCDDVIDDVITQTLDTNF